MAAEDEVMQRRTLLRGLAGLGGLAALGWHQALAQRPAPPHDWVLGAWTGGQFPAVDTEGGACFGLATVIFTRDVVLRATALDTAYRQRLIETVGIVPNGLEFRFSPLGRGGGPMGGQVPPDYGFGCGNLDVLRVERRGPDEIVFPDCSEFPSPLRRCTTPR
jgi:hypothetical protein